MSTINFNGGLGLYSSRVYNRSGVMSDVLNSKKEEIHSDQCLISFGGKSKMKNSKYNPFKNAQNAAMAAINMGKALLGGSIGMAASTVSAKNSTPASLSDEHRRIVKKYGLEKLVLTLEAKKNEGTLSSEDAKKAFINIRNNLFSNSKKLHGNDALLQEDEKDFDIYNFNKYVCLDNNLEYTSDSDILIHDFAEITKIPVISELFKFVIMAYNLDLSNVPPDNFKILQAANSVKFPENVYLPSVIYVTRCNLQEADPRSCDKLIFGIESIFPCRDKFREPRYNMEGFPCSHKNGI